MPKCEEAFSIICNTLTAGAGLTFIGLSSFIINKHLAHEIIMSPAIVEAFVCVSFGCVLIVTEIIINSVWCAIQGTNHRKSPPYKWLFIAAAVWKTLVLIVQMSVGFALFTPDTVRSDINATMTEAFGAYKPGQPSTTESVDRFQHALQCCGLSGYKYWFDRLDGNDVTPGCCKNIEDQDCYKDIPLDDIVTAQNTIYTVGCFDAYTDSMADASLTATVLFFITAGLLVLAVISYAVNVAVNTRHDTEQDCPDGEFTFKNKMADPGESDQLMSNDTRKQFHMTPATA